METTYNKPLTPAQIEEQLQHFTGGGEVYRHTLNRRVIYTEGVRFLAAESAAYWLIDAIALHYGTPQMARAIKRDDRLTGLQFWTLRVREDRSASLSMRVDTGEPAAIRQAIPFTDFPLKKVRIWAGFNGEGWTLYLPSEH